MAAEAEEEEATSLSRDDFVRAIAVDADTDPTGLALLCLLVAGPGGGTSRSPLGIAFQCGTLANSSTLARRPGDLDCLGLEDALTGDEPVTLR